jgi:hypothetical protein
MDHNGRTAQKFYRANARSSIALKGVKAIKIAAKKNKKKRKEIVAALKKGK